MGDATVPQIGEEITVIDGAGGNCGSQGVVRANSRWSDIDWVQVKYHHKVGVKGYLVKANYISWIPASSLTWPSKGA